MTKSPKQTEWQTAVTEILEGYLEDDAAHVNCGISCTETKKNQKQALQAITKATAELVVGEDVQHKHLTRVYDRGCQDRDLINGFKREQRKELGLE